MKNRLTLVLIVLGMSLSAQPNLDSLWGVWNDQTQADTSRLKAMRDIAWDGYLFSQPDSAFYFAQLQYDLAEKSGLKKQMAGALITQGISCAIRGDNPKALDHFQGSLKIFEEIGDKKGIANALNDMGRIYMDQGDYPKALDHFQRSIKIREETGDKDGIAGSLNNIGGIYQSQGDYPKALDHYQRSLKIVEETGYKNEIANALNNMGIVYVDQGDYPKALDYYQSSLKIFEEIGDKNGIANALNNISLIYADQRDDPKALEHFQRSLKIFDKIGDKKGIANILNNMGRTYMDQGDYPKALDHFQRSLKFREETGDENGIAGSLNNIGRIYQDQGDYPKALDYFQRSLKIMEETADKQGIANTRNNIGILYQKQGDHQGSIKECSTGLLLAQEIGVVELQRDACKCLYEAYKTTGNGNKALEYYEHMTVLKDSLFNEENTKKLTRLEMQYKFDEQEAASQAEQEKKDAIAAQELKRQKLVRNGFMGGFAVVLLFAGVFFTQRNRIGKEKARSEELLLNILPEEVAEELKAKGAANAVQIDHVSVLFTDFKGFTAMSEKLSPQDLVMDLHVCFSTFDHICEKYGIEKIKTIGDAYMAAGGLPTPNTTHAMDVINAALEMRDFIAEGMASKVAANLPFFEIRIGIHTGPVVAGIVGVKKFQYDIWGDTVNTASRMESSGEVGQVNISEATYALVKDAQTQSPVTNDHSPVFTFTPRGKIQAKGKGEMNMYFVSRPA